MCGQLTVSESPENLLEVQILSPTPELVKQKSVFISTGDSDAHLRLRTTGIFVVLN